MHEEIIYLTYKFAFTTSVGNLLYLWIERNMYMYFSSCKILEVLQVLLFIFIVGRSGLDDLMIIWQDRKRMRSTKSLSLLTSNSWTQSLQSKYCCCCWFALFCNWHSIPVFLCKAWMAYLIRTFNCTAENFVVNMNLFEILIDVSYNVWYKTS